MIERNIKIMLSKFIVILLILPHLSHCKYLGYALMQNKYFLDGVFYLFLKYFFSGFFIILFNLVGDSCFTTTDSVYVLYYKLKCQKI